METHRSRYTDVKFVNLSIISPGIFGLSCSTFIEMCDTNTTIYKLCDIN